MHLSQLLAAAAFVANAIAVVQFTDVTFTGIKAGQPFQITWQGATAPVTLKLKGGPSTAQIFISTIASGLTGTSFTWTPDTTLPDATYNLEIDSGTDINYSAQFEVTGGTGTTSVASSSGAASTSGSSSATSSSAPSSAATSSSGSSTSSSPSSSKSSGSSTSSSASSTSSAASVPTSNSAIQNGSPFALVIMGALAIAGLN